jgi:hypothetical protein
MDSIARPGKVDGYEARAAANVQNLCVDGQTKLTDPLQAPFASLPDDVASEVVPVVDGLPIGGTRFKMFVNQNLMFRHFPPPNDGRTLRWCVTLPFWKLAVEILL